MKLIIVIVLALASSAFARIGETEQQIEARYGKSIDATSRPGEPLRRTYFYSGLYVGVAYIDKASQSEFFSKKDKSELSNNEIEILLGVNSGGGKWVESKDAEVPPGLRGWKLEPNGWIAVYNMRSLIISTPEYRKVADELKAKTEKEKLKGF